MNPNRRLVAQIKNVEGIQGFNLIEYMDVLEIDEILSEFSEDIKDLVNKFEFEELKEKGLNNLTFKDLDEFDIPFYLAINSDNYCKVYINEIDETLLLFYKEDYMNDRVFNT